jgi:hypothetical protein
METIHPVTVESRTSRTLVTDYFPEVFLIGMKNKYEVENKICRL